MTNRYKLKKAMRKNMTSAYHRIAVIANKIFDPVAFTSAFLDGLTNRIGKEVLYIGKD